MLKRFEEELKKYDSVKELKWRERRGWLVQLDDERKMAGIIPLLSRRDSSEPQSRESLIKSHSRGPMT